MTALVATAVLGVLVIPEGWASASHTPAFVDDGTGITCTVSGSLTFTPPLAFNAAGSSTVGFHDQTLFCSGAVRQFGVTLARGFGHPHDPIEIPRNCLLIAEDKTAAVLPGFTMKTTYGTNPPGYSPPPSFTTWGPGTLSSTKIGSVQGYVVHYGNATAVSGSFSSGTGPPPSLTIVLDLTSVDLISVCGSPSEKGLSRATFTGAVGTSMVTLG